MTRKNKKFIVSIIMAMMMVLAMMPSMAFADTANIDGTTYTSTITIADPGTIPRGASVPMTYSHTTNYSGTVHVDWTVEDSDGSATIDRHQGNLIGVTAGEVTLTATLKTGEAGTGSGNQTGCSGEELASTSITVEIVNSDTYGYQGLGGNTLKMLSPVTPTAAGTTNKTVNGTQYTVYNNNMTGVGVSNNQCLFGYTMSAGVNNFKEDTFNTYANQITIAPVDSSAVSSTPAIAYDSFDSTTKTIYLKATNLEAGKAYTLSFGPNVCGNNPDKKLGCYIEFNVNTVSAQ